MKNICASCDSIALDRIVRTSQDKNPEWLDKIDYVKNFIESTNLKSHEQKNTNMNMTVHLGDKYKNRMVLYWAALPLGKRENGLHIKTAKDAYMGDNNRFRNYGVSKCNKDGNIEVKLDCPQPYWTREKGKKTNESYYRHFHFCYSNSANTEWLSSVYTKIVIYSMSLKETLTEHKKGNVVLINALPCEYYGKEHIPNSFNLPVKACKKTSQQELLLWFNDVLEKNYTNIKNAKGLELYEIPIVVYCAHKGCDAGYNCAMELMKKGFINVRDFKGGMKEYNER